MHKLFVITGPSGVGKTTISNLVEARANALAEATGSTGVGLGRVITTTTRDPRPGEVNDVDYHFRTVDEFERMVNDREFAEFAEVYGNLYGNTYAAIDQATVNHNAIIVTDVQGAVTLGVNDRVETVFIRPASTDVLRDRLGDRNDVEQRLATAVDECQLADKFDHVVVNDDLGQAVLEVERIING